MNWTSQTPKARKAELLTKELGTELLVYDLSSKAAHCLNSTAATVWTHCDGSTTIEQIARLLKHETKTPAGPEVVWFALEQLKKARLLQAPFVNAPPGNHMSRRVAMKRLGAAAVITLPSVSSIVAPTAAAAATCFGSGDLCSNNAQCCSNSCVDNGRGVFQCT